MADYQISGGIPIKGTIDVQGSKNAALPILAASLLHEGVTILHGCPNILDVRYMVEILRSLGCLIDWNKDALIIDASCIRIHELSRACIGKMRSSILLLGALLGRCQTLKLDYPGGCTIGARPVDIHLDAFKRMGVHIEEDEEQIFCQCAKLKACQITLPYPSVGATENIMMAAVLADGITWIHNAAMEPEVGALADYLNTMGAVVLGAGTKRIGILGRCALKDVEYTIMGDRIVAGTYLLAAAGTRGSVEVRGVEALHLHAILHICESMGCRVRTSAQSIYLEAPNRLLGVDEIHTQPYPGVPTDLQSQLLAVLTTARGETMLQEHVFEKRFRTAQELRRMGADICVWKNQAFIRGVPSLRGGSVKAMDLRGGAALIIAGLMAEGETIVKNSIFVERGYQDICQDLTQLGAMIQTINRD